MSRGNKEIFHQNMKIVKNHSIHRPKAETPLLLTGKRTPKEETDRNYKEKKGKIKSK